MHQFKQSGFFNLIGNILLLVIIIGGITYALNQNGYGLKITTSSGNDGNNGTQSEGFQYTVQVSVTPSEKKAMDLVNDLEVDGYDAYYDTYESDQGHFYKVRVGEYENRRAASAIENEVKSRYKKYKDSFVQLLND
ncbi:MAG TPA: SPOR domain-containing protein [Thiothrix sp.]|nr:SPOR domain-containing protein [Thiothrix sp.]